jgi:hypothetical protein
VFHGEKACDEIEGFFPTSAFQFDDTSSGGARGEYKPDGTIYDKSKMSAEHDPTVVDLVHAEWCVEAKTETSQDCFTDASNGGLTIKGKCTPRILFGQLHDYANKTIRNNYWTHCFAILIFSDNARLLRWDHAVVYVSAVFSIVEDGHVFAMFAHAFSNTASLEDRGWEDQVYPDDTAKYAKRVRTEMDAKPSVAIRHWRKSFDGPLQCFHVKSKPGQGKKRKVFTCIGPFFPPVQSPCIVGRATRG